MESKAMKALRAELENKQKEAQALMNKEDVKADEITTKTDEIKAVRAKMEAQKAMDEGRAFDANGDEINDTQPVNNPVYAEPLS